MEKNSKITEKVLLWIIVATKRNIIYMAGFIIFYLSNVYITPIFECIVIQALITLKHYTECFIS